MVRSTIEDGWMWKNERHGHMGGVEKVRWNGQICKVIEKTGQPFYQRRPSEAWNAVKNEMATGLKRKKRSLEGGGETPGRVPRWDDLWSRAQAPFDRQQTHHRPRAPLGPHANSYI